MNAVIFSGPTLDAGTITDVLAEAEVLPPVSQGDVYKVALRHPLALGIIDGYFEHVPAVWHKEILWAMSQGVHVFGAASLGALRAAELESFGMIGVGEVFEACRTGYLDDDDVAVTHGPENIRYRTASEALVNIRATLRKATHLRIIRAATQATLERAAKSLFYADRNYPRLFELARTSVPRDELASLRERLPSIKVDQKREDALALLRRIRELLQEYPGPKRVSFQFENTLHWENLKRNLTIDCED